MSDPRGTDSPTAEACARLADEVAGAVLDRLRERRGSLATAESLTGGLIGALITAVAGASDVYRGGVVAYATDLKASLVGVAPETLAREGPVAASTAHEMALGIAQRCGARYGLAVTGVAGPTSQDGHPVGQVFVAVADVVANVVTVREHRLSGSRARIRLDTARLALGMLAEQLESGAGP